MYIIIGKQYLVIGEADAFQFPILRLTPSGSRSSPFKTYPSLKNHLLPRQNLSHIWTERSAVPCDTPLLRFNSFILLRKIFFYLQNLYSGNFIQYNCNTWIPLYCVLR